MDSKVTQTYIYVHPFSPKLPSHPGCTEEEDTEKGDKDIDDSPRHLALNG